jgi:predicted nucleotidyltransferase component of viral defense system
MNEIGNKILSKVTNLSDFHKNLDEHNKHGKVDTIDRKIFYLFENIKDDKKSKQKKTSSENTGTDASHHKKSYSILDIAKLETKDLCEKIFTFDKKVGKDLSKTT